MDSSKYYKIEGDKLVRTHRACPKCGPSFFLANHYDRWSCGKCGNTIFKRKSPAKTKAARRTPRKRTKSKES
ncbi:MAG: 30S ribosomal protein S27ae [Promethearchaeota archaeon]|nr:MAG: 30S ribosomal protein S27ae [Candidatus Lokiarchaeota archaeon]